MGAVILFLKSGLGRSVSIGAVFLLVLGSCQVQTMRLKSAKADLVEARAALYVPHSKPRVTWKAAGMSGGTPRTLRRLYTLPMA